MNILITGGAGYVGTALVARLCDEGHKVVVLDDLSNGKRHFLDMRVSFVEGSILSKDDLEDVFSMFQYDWVIHCAALKSAPDSEKNPTDYYRTNLSGLINVLSYMEKNKVKNIVFSSTAAVYAPDESGLYHEESSIRPPNIYGATKDAGEQIIEQMYRTRVLDRYVIFRYFNVAGDCGIRYLNESDKNIFSLLTRVVRDDAMFTITGTNFATPDGSGVRDYIHIEDLVEAHLRALGSDYSGIFNLGSQHGYSVREILQAFEEVSGRKIDVTEGDKRTGDAAIAIADASLAKKLLGWETTKTIHDMVQSSLATIES